MTIVTTPRVLATVPSKSNPNKSYEIRLGRDGVVYCNCKAWQMNKYCKHLEEYHNNCAKQVSPPSTLATNYIPKPNDVMIKFFEDQVKNEQPTGACHATASVNGVDARDNITRIVQDGIMGGKW